MKTSEERAESILESLTEIRDAASVQRSSLTEKKIRDYLTKGTGGAKLARIKRSYPAWRLALVTYALEEILNSKKGFELVEPIGLGYDDEWVFERTELPIGPGKKHFCFSNGNLLVNAHGQPMVIVIDSPRYISPDRQFSISVCARDGSEKEVQEFFRLIDEWIKDNNFYHHAAISPDGEFLDIKKFNWDDLIVEDRVKDAIKQNILDLVDKQKLYLKYKIQTKRGILISGPPGCGKTLTGKIIANTVESSFIWVTPKFLTSTSALENIFKFAREISPTILYFEDVDLYAQDREEHDNRSVILGELLNQMDGIVGNDSVITIMTTNYPDKLEKALKDRPGRFDRHIKIGVPSKAIRKRMYQHFAKDCVTEGVDWDKIVDKGKKFTGCHLAEVIAYAKMLAVDASKFDKDGKLILTQDLIETSVDAVVAHFEAITASLGFGNAKDAKRLRGYDDDDEW